VDLIAALGLRLLVVVGLAAVSACSQSAADAAALTHGGDASRGESLIRSYGCGACHAIPRVPGATAVVGPNLQGIARRAYIAGVVPNQPPNMIRWIMDPPAVDIAAYLYTLQ
jgi:hypothetical protein